MHMHLRLLDPVWARRQHQPYRRMTITYSLNADQPPFFTSGGAHAFESGIKPPMVCMQRERIY